MNAEVTQVADNNETQTSEEDDTDETRATSAPPPPPRNFRQAATYILGLVRWNEPKDGVVQLHRNQPATLHTNYYKPLLDLAETETETKRLKIRPELITYGRSLLKTKGGLNLTLNATKLSTEDNEKQNTSSTQTPDTVSTSTNRTISFSSSAISGLTAPMLLPTAEDSDSSITIEQKCFEAGEPCESNAESAERHRDIERNVLRKKKRRDKRRRKLNKRLQRLLEKQLREESDDETSSTKGLTLKQCVQELTLDDINPHDLYPTPDIPLTTQPISLLYDTGASITMLPLDYAPAWRNLRPCLHQLTGCFAQEGTHYGLQIGEFHGLLKLDNEEMVRIIIPEAVALPTGTSTTYLLSDTQFLLAGNSYNSDLRKPTITFKTGGTYTMNVNQAHKVVEILPIPATTTTQHRQVYAHLTTRYDPPTYHNNAIHSKRPNAHTPPAYQWHLRYACACQPVLQRTQANVRGMQVQEDS